MGSFAGASLAIEAAATPDTLFNSARSALDSSGARISEICFQVADAVRTGIAATRRTITVLISLLLSRCVLRPACVQPPREALQSLDARGRWRSLLLTQGRK